MRTLKRAKNDSIQLERKIPGFLRRISFQSTYDAGVLVSLCIILFFSIKYKHSGKNM